MQQGGAVLSRRHFRDMHLSIPAVHTARVIVLAAFLLLAAIVPSAHAQPDQRHLTLGARVRIVRAAGEESFIGNVARVTSDSIAVGVGGANVMVQLPLAHLASLEVSDGRDRAKWTANGTLYGALGVGLITGVLFAQEYPGTLMGPVGALAGGFMGAIGGGVAGAMLAPEQWDRVALPSRSP